MTIFLYFLPTLPSPAPAVICPSNLIRFEIRNYAKGAFKIYECWAILKLILRYFNRSLFRSFINKFYFYYTTLRDYDFNLFVLLRNLNRVFQNKIHNSYF